MLEYNPNSQLISIHIPKTGGTAFRHILSHWFGEKLLLHYYNEKHQQMPIKWDDIPGTCIHGHFNRKRGFGFEDYYPQAKQMITFLRDPFEILVSRYFYMTRPVKTENLFFNGNIFNPSEKSADYIKEEIHNPNYHPNILDYLPAGLNKFNYKDILEEKFVFIGTLEKIQRSMELLSLKLGFPYEELKVENHAPRKEDSYLFYREEFMDSHPLEYEIFNYFNHQIEM